MFKWVTKKDLIYWLIIVITIWLITSKFDVTLNQWGFAGTIISIILAVLAIIYTYEQSSSTFYSNKKLEESAEKIENVTQLLEKTSINDLFINLETRIESLNSRFDESMNTQKKDFELILQKNLFKHKGKNDVELFTQDEWKKYLENTNFFTISGIMLLYVYFTYKNDVKVNFDLLGNFIATKGETDAKQIELLGPVLKHVFRGALAVFVSLGVCDETIKDDKIINLSPIFEKAMTEVISNSKESDIVRDISNFVNKQKGH